MLRVFQNFEWEVPISGDRDGGGAGRGKNDEIEDLGNGGEQLGAARAGLARGGPRAGLGPSPRAFCPRALGLSINHTTALRTTPATMAKQENSC